MISVAEAQQIVLREARPRGLTRVNLGSAVLGLVLGEDIQSDIDSPPFDKAMVDGFALRSADVSHPRVELILIEEILAGHVARHAVGAGQCSRIMTGAPIPAGADAVIMHERTELVGERVRMLEGPKCGQNILRQGSEMRAGQKVLAAGSLLRAQEFGVLASVGRMSFQAIRRPTVAILSTGDEIVEPGVRPGPGQIRNSNASLLEGLAASAGAEPNILGVAKDTPESLTKLIREGLRADVLLLSGGVSAGKLDLVPGALVEQGVKPQFHKVSLKPGKPIWFGTKDDKLVFGLPGNPVGSFVGFELFVRPALRVLRGLAPNVPLPITAQLSGSLRHKSDRPTYHPAKVTSTANSLVATPVKWQGSPDLLATTASNGWLVLPAGELDLAAGAEVSVLLPELDLN